MDNLTLGLFAVIFTALVVTLILVHRENRRIHRLMERERFIPIDRHGVIFEPEPIGATTSNDHFAIERQYDHIRPIIDKRPRGHYGTQHNIDIDGDGE